MDKKRKERDQVRQRPPAYPQVEHLHELDDAVCRHCNKPIGDDIELELKDIKALKAGIIFYLNWFCTCGNKFKII